MEEVYVELPKAFDSKDKLDKIILQLKSLYGLKQAPKTFFFKLSTCLIERGFTPLAHYSYLFIKKKHLMRVIHADDTIIARLDSDDIEHERKLLGITNDTYSHTFQLRD